MSYIVTSQNGKLTATSIEGHAGLSTHLRKVFTRQMVEHFGPIASGMTVVNPEALKNVLTNWQLEYSKPARISVTKILDANGEETGLSVSGDIGAANSAMPTNIALTFYGPAFSIGRFNFFRGEISLARAAKILESRK